MTSIQGQPSFRGLSATLALCLAACSPESASATGTAPPTENKTESRTPAPAPRPAASRSAPAVTPAAPDKLTLQGLDTLEIGKPLPRGSTWRERGAQIPGLCRTIGSPDFPGVYGIVEDGEVRRISVGPQSKVTLREGIGAGTSEAAVRAAFPRFREEPHKYVESPAKYLTSPRAAGGVPALRFEISREGRVSLIHVGTMPVLGYVEGCA